MVVTKPRAPVGSLQDGLECAGKVHKHVAHQEEPIHVCVCVSVCVCVCARVCNRDGFRSHLHM